MVANDMNSTTKKRFLLVYGSETGQAKAIAEDIADKSASHSLEADLHCADGVDKKFDLLKEDLFVFVCSTTGEGEPPDNAAKFLRRLKNKSLKESHLSHLRYALLGLGDTNYTNFCNCPKEFHKHLQALGAQSFYDPGWADDGVGLDIVCDPWIEGLWPALRRETATTRDSASMGDTTAISVDSNGTELLSSSATSSTTATPSTNATTPPPSTASLIRSTAPLCDASLSVPAEAPPFLLVEWSRDGAEFISPQYVHNDIPFPSSTSPIFDISVKGCWRLTSDDAVKTALDICISTTDTPLRDFRPGDAFGIVVRNPQPEVDVLLRRLFPLGEGKEETEEGREDFSGTAETPFRLSLMEKTGKVKAEIPPFIPTYVTSRYMFEDLLDIRSVPKKAFLRLLAKYCRDEKDQRRLLELSSKQGSKDYDTFIRQPSLGFVDILVAFSSLQPPLSRVIEHLPRLQARSYSISSSPLRCPGRAHFVFNVVEMVRTADQAVVGLRKGVCTGMLDDLTKRMRKQGSPAFVDDDCDDLGRLSIDDASHPIRLSVFTRPNLYFHHPDDDLQRPLIMVGPGTGVAPFVGFLQHREKLMERQSLSTADIGVTWLFFGCRHQHRDFLYESELNRLHSQGVLTHLETSFSRDSETITKEEKVPTTTTTTSNVSSSTQKKYVQHRILERSQEIGALLVDASAMLFVCGDAKNMARNVNDALIDVLMRNGGMTKMGAMKHLADMREQKRYLQDVWA